MTRKRGFTMKNMKAMKNDQQRRLEMVILFTRKLSQAILGALNVHAPPAQSPGRMHRWS